MTVRVLLADDQVLIRSGFAALINSVEDLEVVGAGDEGGEARPDQHLVVCEQHADGHGAFRGMTAETR